MMFRCCFFLLLIVNVNCMDKTFIIIFCLIYRRVYNFMKVEWILKYRPAAST